MEDVIDDLKIEIVGDSYTAEKSIDKVFDTDDNTTIEGFKDSAKEEQ